VENVAVLLLALAIDLAFGDPPNAFHPVAWLGRLIAPVMRPALRSGQRRQFVYGLVVVSLVTVAAAAGVYFLLVNLYEVSVIAYVIAAALLLKASFSLRGLRSAAVSVKRLLSAGKDDQARFELRALVGRDTAGLDRSQMTSAVVESVAENSCDSFVAPLFYFILFGVPGAVAYRVINTFDAMVGHHGEWEYPGKFAARLDDAANYIPARLSAFLLALATGVTRQNLAGAWRVMRRDHRLTESPNAGWTMSAAAGALGLTLEKVGYYRLGGDGAAPTVAAIGASLSLLTGQAVIWAGMCLIVEVLRAAFT